MEITKANYEQYFIDYLDGNLSNREIGMLEAFLLVYPELRDELEGLERISLNPHNETFSFKESLKRSDLSLPVNENNFEDFCIASAEGDLGKNLFNELHKYFANHPEDYHTYLTYKKLHLVPDHSDRYPSRGELKKPVRLYSNELIYAAVSVAAVIILFYFIFNKPEKSFIQSEIQQTAQIEAKTKKPLDNNQDPYKIIAEDNKLPVKKIGLSEIQVNTKKNTGGTTKGINPVSINEGIDEKKIKSEIFDLSNLSVEINIPVLPEYEIIIPEIKPESFIKENRSPEKYINLREFAKQELTEKVLGKKETSVLSVWDIADASIDGISRITGSKMDFDKTTDDEGRINKVLFESKFISFYTSMNR